METPTSLIIAAAFEDRLGAARAAGAMAATHHRVMGVAALGDVVTDGTPHRGASVRWSSGRGALVRGALGLTGGPLRLVECGTDATTDRSREFGVPSAQLTHFGTSLRRGDSVVVFEIRASAVQAARSRIEALGPRDTIVTPFDLALGALRDCVDECLTTPFAA